MITRRGVSTRVRDAGADPELLVLGSGACPARAGGSAARPIRGSSASQRVVALSGGARPGQRPAPGVGQQVNLGTQPAAGTAQASRSARLPAPAPDCCSSTQPLCHSRGPAGPPAPGLAPVRV